MPVLHIVVLALIQGITEFLPISSQAHLQLVSAFTGWADQGLMMDVAVHVGTLGAVMAYFWRDIWAMTAGVAQLLRGLGGPGARLAGFLIIGTLPALAAGYLVSRYYPNGIRGIEIIAWTTLGFGVALYIADKVGMTVRRIEHIKFGDIIIIGCAQALALIPGTSRSGITMTTARLLGMERRDGVGGAEHRLGHADAVRIVLVEAQEADPFPNRVAEGLDRQVGVDSHPFLGVQILGGHAQHVAHRG